MLLSAGCNSEGVVQQRSGLQGQRRRLNATSGARWENIAVLIILFWALKLLACAHASVTDCPVGIRVTVIYNALIWPEQNWGGLIRSQLDQLQDTGLVECANIHAVLSVPAFHKDLTYDVLEAELAKGRRLINERLPSKRGGNVRNIIVSQIHENAHEYPGIHLLWLLAQEITPENAARNVFLYFHTKGMVNHGYQTSRFWEEAKLFDSVVVPWRHAIEIFARNATLTRCGTFPTSGGYMYLNFWWARASYIQRVVEPLKTTRRHYYEEWLGMLYDSETDDNPEPGRHDDCTTCYSMNGGCSGYGITYESTQIPSFCHGKGCGRLEGCKGGSLISLG